MTVKISDMTASAPLDGTEQVEIVQGGSTRRTTVADFAIHDHSVHVDDYGAVGDGVTDDYAAIRAAYVAADGGYVQFAAKTYAIGTRLDMDGEGGHLRGYYTATNDAGTKLVPLTVGQDLIRISKSWNCSIKGFWLDGDGSTGLNAIVLHNAAQCTIENVIIRYFSDSGVLLDMNATTPVGNNNGAVLRNVTVHWCNYGIRTIEGNDNNTIELYSPNIGSNTQDGILLKGSGWKIYGGLFEANGAYAIRISESGDAGFSTASAIIGCWLESNVSGGIHGDGKSARNLIWSISGTQGLTGAAGSLDVLFKAQSGTSSIFEIDGGQGAQIHLRAGIASATVTVEGPTNTPLYLRPKGSSAVVINDIGSGGASVGSGPLVLGGDLDHDGTNVGFFGTTPAAQPAAYTRTATAVEDRTLAASASATATNNNNVLAALIADLQSLGIIG